MEAESNEDLFSNYHCSPEWHMAQLTSTPFAGLLYGFAYRISKKTQRFHGSVVGVAEHFGVSRSKVQRAIKALVKLGVFVEINKEPFSPSVYRVLSHKEWAEAYPGRCAVKQKLPWSDEAGDPLGVRLWSASGGKIRYMPHKLAALRNTGLSDEQIVGHFEEFIAVENARRQSQRWHGRWAVVSYRFFQWLTGKISPNELEKLGLRPAALSPPQ
jgi:hypothetical protein